MYICVDSRNIKILFFHNDHDCAHDDELAARKETLCTLTHTPPLEPPRTPQLVSMLMVLLLLLSRALTCAYACRLLSMPMFCMVSLNESTSECCSVSNACRRVCVTGGDLKTTPNAQSYHTQSGQLPVIGDVIDNGRVQSHGTESLLVLRVHNELHSAGDNQSSSPLGQ